MPAAWTCARTWCSGVACEVAEVSQAQWVFDDERAVANAGVMPALLAGRLGLEQPIDDCLDLGDRPGAANPGRKVMSRCSAMVLGADCIDDCDVLRSAQTRRCSGIGSRHRRPWAGSRARSRSGTCGNWTACSGWRSSGRGPPG